MKSFAYYSYSYSYLSLSLYLLLELHNRIIELLRAIYCDSNSILITTEINSNSSFSSSLDCFLNSFEFNLLPPEESFDDLEKDNKEDINNDNTEIIIINSSLSTRKFNTSIEKMGLTTSEEALISEAMRNPIHVQRNLFNTIFLLHFRILLLLKEIF